MEVLKRFIRKLSVVLAFLGTLGVFVAVAYMVSTHDVYRLEQRLISQDGTVAKAYFSPEDDVLSLLISLIDAEHKSIKFAIYTFTNKLIAEAFIRASLRGVLVEGVVDRSYGQSRYSKVCMLANAHVPLWVYQTAANERQAGLMHNKFCVFEDNITHKSLVWTGSYNFTNRASNKNQENVVILDRQEVVNSFNNYFARLKTYSLQISGALPCSTHDESQSAFTGVPT